MASDNKYKELNAKKALDVITKLIRGNITASDGIKIIRHDYSDIHCEALNHIELSYDINEAQPKKIPDGAIPISDPSQIPMMANKQTQQILKNSETRKLLAQQLLSRSDKGFAVHGEYFDLPQMMQIYQYLQACKACEGKKAKLCDRCNGARQETCSQCHGARNITCKQCRGAGAIQGRDGKPQNCGQCFGKKAVQCPLCRARGIITCRICKGSGDVQCHHCKGAGAYNFITEIKYKMKTLFEIDRAALPDVAVKMIENKGSVLVQQKHIALQTEQVKREDGGLAIQYQLTFPFSNITINVNGKPVRLYVFGFRGKIMKVTNFLDQLIEKNYALLMRAADNDGNINSHIRKASKSRLIADGLYLSLSLPARQAMKELKKKYPYAASNSLLKDIIVKSKMAFDHVTQKNRYIGAAFGLLLSAAIMAGYFYAGVRSATGVAEPTLWILDFALIPFGIALVIGLSKFLAQRPLKLILKELSLTKKSQINSKVKPRTSNNITLAIIGNIILFLMIVYGLRFTNAPNPSWMIF